MNQEENQNQQKKLYNNPLDEQLNYKAYQRLMSVLFAIFVILGIMQSYMQFKKKRDSVLTFL